MLLLFVLFYFILNLNLGQICGLSSSVSVRDTYWFLCLPGSSSDYLLSSKCFKAVSSGIVNECVGKNWKKYIGYL